MTDDTLGGTYTLGDFDVHRMGYGAMRLSGEGIFGPPKDRDEAISVLRTAVELGIDHIDTSDFYGPHETNKVIREALAPYPDNLHIVTKVGARRDDQGNWLRVDSPDELRQQVRDNLDNLGLERLDVVNFRIHSGEGNGRTMSTESVATQFGVLADLQKEGLIRHLGISTATAEQVAEAQSIAPVVCVQNLYNIAARDDDALIDSLNEQGIAYVPYFPLGGFSPLQSETLGNVAQRLDATPMQVALAWLLQRSPNILLIPGTSSVGHLRENVAAADLALDDAAMSELDSIGMQV